MVDLRQAYSDFSHEIRTGMSTCIELLEKYIKNSSSPPPRNLDHAFNNTFSSPPTQHQLTILDDEENNRSIIQNTSVDGTPSITAEVITQQLNPEQQTLATVFFIADKQNSKGISLSTIFYEWYMREWHTLDLIL